MSYPQILPDGSIQLTHDTIDLLVAIVEMIDTHKSLSDDDPVKSAFMDMTNRFNKKLCEDLHKLGLDDLFEVRNRLEFGIRSIIKARAQAYLTLQNLIDERI